MKFLGPNSYKGKNYFELCFKLLKTTEMKQIERQQHVCFDEKVAEVFTSWSWHKHVFYCILLHHTFIAVGKIQIHSRFFARKEFQNSTDPKRKNLK